MKKITTLITEATLRGEKAVTFTVVRQDIHYQLINKMPINGGTLSKGVRTFVNDNVSILVEDEAYQSSDGLALIHIGIIIAPTAIELILQDMGLTQKPRESISENELSQQLIQTYNDVGVYDWIHQKVPDGVRSMVAYQYGYQLDMAFNDMFNKAWTLADDYLLQK